MSLTLSAPTAAATGLREGAFGNAVNLVCRECGTTRDLGPFYACAECFGPLEIGYEFGNVTREQIEAGPANIWRYKALLPVPDDIAESPNLEPGFTRLLDAKNLAAELGLKKLWVKDDSTNPTNSFKDRVVAIALSAATEFGSKVFAALQLATSRTPSLRPVLAREFARSYSSRATSKLRNRSTQRSIPRT